MSGAGAGPEDELLDPRAAWNQGADAWETFVESGADYYRREVHGPALLDACLPLEGASALDLGCGQGYFSRGLAMAGAAVVAVDISEKMIEYAVGHERAAPLGVEYVLGEASGVAEVLRPGSFDLVTACMSLQDMRDVTAVLGAAYQMLRSAGRMVFSVPHPATDTPFREWERDASGSKICLKIDGYFETGPTICDWSMPRLAYQWKTPFWRYTLSQWTDALATAGFTIRRVVEPRPTSGQVSANPDLEDCFRLPYFLIFAVSKA